MVDLKGQYAKIQKEIDEVVLDIIRNATFINGPEVARFSDNLSRYLGGSFVIPCANGTDALQIALMALGLEPGDEVIVPAFTYVATAEVIGLLKLTPVMVDVDPYCFNIDLNKIEQAITPKTKAIVPVHLFGQCSDIEPICQLAKKKNLFVVEDVAQAIGSDYTFKDGSPKKAGTIGDIGCTSFFPSKNLGCYGDGGALFTSDQALSEKIRMIANHGQVKKYVHKYIGVNSRLDTIQAGILDIKLKHLDTYSSLRRAAADRYDALLSEIEEITTPARSNSTHVFHQYTIQVKNGRRNELKQYLENSGIPAMIYYPIPLHHQEAFKKIGIAGSSLNVTEQLCDTVLSIPMHTELTEEEQLFICSKIKSFLK
jgi:dTDP-4-amino-4,6-dideoxygalactose transaminase